jgi:peptidoglycan/LPS O-acetylase OafA/YrhL
VNVVRRESRALLAGTIARATRIGGYGESARPILVRTPRPSRAYLPALDGVRAIAILVVIVSHVIIVCHTANELPGMTTAQNFFVSVAGLGWMGVDLFFVLSGFLITGILLDVRNRENALGNFYVRRILRIVPLYVAFLLFTMWVATALGLSSIEETAKLRHTQLWYWTYSMNVVVARSGWGATTLLASHLWSLAVEEQFYLLWPVAALILSPLAVRRTAVGCIIGAEACRVTFALAGAGGQVSYVLLPSRMDSLAAGAFLACAFRDPVLWSRVLRARRGLTLAALLSMLATVLIHDSLDSQSTTAALVLYPAIVALAAVVVSTAADGTRWLSGRVMRFIGRISYGMYVWHILALRVVLTRMKIPEIAAGDSWWAFYGVAIGGTVLCTVLIALVSWHLIEQPFLQLKRFVPSAD